MAADSGYLVRDNSLNKAIQFYSAQPMSEEKRGAWADDIVSMARRFEEYLKGNESQPTGESEDDRDPIIE